LITRSEILNILERDFKIKITPRTFDFYKSEGLIPQIQARKNRKGLYPEKTPEIIVKIKEMQEEGLRLSEIKDFANFYVEKTKLYAQIDDYLAKEEFYKGWNNPKAREQRIISFLKLKRKGKKYDSGMIFIPDGKAIIFLAEFYTNHINFFRILVGLYQPGNEELLEQKKLKYDEYKSIVRALIKPITENGRVMDREDIFLAIFA